MENYTPPYEITEEMLELTAQIMELIGQLNNVDDLQKLPRLRKVSRIQSIHSSLAIENNTLSFEQVSDVINGKKVLGPREDILAVKNAFAAYKKLSSINVFSITDLLSTHAIMMDGLAYPIGQFRTGAVGVVNDNGAVLHVAPPALAVPELMCDLFTWLENSKTSMLIRSCIFHYEFEFIHPFSDGNGRMGRLWQTALLSSWKPIFEWLPIESIIKDNQPQYYAAISQSTSQGKSNAFITFMMNVIKSALTDLINDTRKHYNHLSQQIYALLNVMQSYPMSAQEIMQKLGLKSRNGFRQNYLTPALEAGLIGMTHPDKPTSRNQRYFKV